MNKKTVLLVEDNPSISKLVEYKLLKDGYTVVAKTNGLEGYEAAKEMQPDILILDVMMPGMNGFELLEKFKKEFPDSNTKVIMLTSKSREEDIQRGFSLGVLEYMGKPFKVAELSMRVKKVADL
ncbi:MAG: response regulator [Bacteroidetes bacterium]|nr:response regulator [Bacteroidota bacterium]MCH8524410.1 response regulator [Balneolales bacterium]